MTAEVQDSSHAGKHEKCCDIECQWRQDVHKGRNMNVNHQSTISATSPVPSLTLIPQPHVSTSECFMNIDDVKRSDEGWVFLTNTVTEQMAGALWVAGPCVQISYVGVVASRGVIVLLSDLHR